MISARVCTLRWTWWSRDLTVTDALMEATEEGAFWLHHCCCMVENERRSLLLPDLRAVVRVVDRPSVFSSASGTPSSSQSERVVDSAVAQASADVDLGEENRVGSEARESRL